MNKDNKAKLALTIYFTVVLVLAAGAIINFYIRIFAFSLLGIGILIIIWVLTFGKKNIYRKNKEIHISKDKIKALSTGLILSSWNREYVNSLEMYPEKKEKQIKEVEAKNLEYMWGINDTDTAIDTLDWLKNEGQNFIYEFIFMDKNFTFFAHPENDIYKEIAREKLLQYNPDGSYFNRFLQYRNNLKNSINLLKEEKVIKELKDLHNIKAVAWDIGRIVNVARWCYMQNYISKETAWNYIEYAYKKAKENYKSWDEFAKGFMLGRILWCGNNGSHEFMFLRIKILITDKESPWVMYPLN
ncbi:MAG: DUF1266 domain-containing protein [Defluviitaleaceae bacterium]|nr:DUF1266 domain-containing protein [Defluviitaleaceae bacterium]